MWSEKVHRIANILSLLLILLITIGMIGFLLDVGIIGKLLGLVVVLVFVKILIFYLLQKLKVILIINKKVKQKTTTKSKVEEAVILDEQQQYLTDLKLQARNLFKNAIQSKKLTRAEVLSIKDYLLSNVDDPELKTSRYKNEAHCIYSAIKSNYIKEDVLNNLIKYIFVFANRKPA